MTKSLVFLLLLAVLTGCELFTIDNKKRKSEKIEINQQNPLGAVYLFKTEIDSGDVYSALRILASGKGKLMLATDKYEMLEDISRIARIITSKPVTSIHRDSLSVNSYRFRVQFDYIKIITFSTEKINDRWYIISFNE